MIDNDTRRLSRLTAILTQLQSKRVLTGTTLAGRFGVSVRTIYRDIRALQDGGVPILTEEGRGYSLMEGYKIPPVMFTETEANALITAELLIMASKDESLIKEFSSAIQKVKAIMPHRLKDRIENLEEKVAVTKFYTGTGEKSRHLLTLQGALLERVVLKISYINRANIASDREVEPFAVYSNTNDEWVLVAFCRLRKEFRSFSVSKIEQLAPTAEKFPPHNISFASYIQQKINLLNP